MGTRASDITTAVGEFLLGKLELSGEEVPASAGVSAEQARRFWQALGFPSAAPGDAIFTKRDVEALSFIAMLLHRNDHRDTGMDDDGRDREMLLQMTRATGQALSRVAHMHVLSIGNEIADVTRDGELTNSQAGDRVSALAESLVRSYEPFLGYIWRRHLLSAISQVVATAAGQVGEAENTTVGFADLVGFTAITQQLSDEELAEVVEHFEKIAYEEIAEHGGRVVKTLGDEVMFSNPSPAAAGETALAIAEGCRNDPVLPDVRVGLAIGSMLAWEGDYYGPTVNLASRLAGIATPGTVIVSDQLAERLADEDTFRLIEIRGVKLKGIGKTKPWVLRHRAAEASTR